jgi:hypothetical protein
MSWLSQLLHAVPAWLEDFTNQTLHNEVAALAPIAEKAAAEIATQLIADSDNLTAFAAHASTILTATAAAAEQAGVKAAGASLLTAVGGATSSVIAAAAQLATNG